MKDRTGQDGQDGRDRTGQEVKGRDGVCKVRAAYRQPASTKGLHSAVPPHDRTKTILSLGKVHRYYMLSICATEV